MQRSLLSCWSCCILAAVNFSTSEHCADFSHSKYVYFADFEIKYWTRLSLMCGTVNYDSREKDIKLSVCAHDKCLVFLCMYVSFPWATLCSYILVVHVVIRCCLTSIKQAENPVVFSPGLFSNTDTSLSCNCHPGNILHLSSHHKLSLSHVPGHEKDRAADMRIHGNEYSQEVLENDPGVTPSVALTHWLVCCCPQFRKVN